MKQKILTTPLMRIGLALIAADAAIFSFINPAKAGASWLIIGYALFGLTLIWLSELLVQGLKPYGGVVERVGKRLLRYGSALVVLLIGLQSIGQLTVKDLLSLLPLVVVAYWYVNYGRKTATQQA